MNDDNPNPMDPNVEPPGYKPPTSAEELLERYARGERVFKYTVLPNADFGRKNLSGVVLVDADLRGACLARTDLMGATLTRASLQGADFLRSQATRLDLGLADLDDARLDEANLGEANLSGATLAHASFRGSQLVEAHLDRASAEHSDFTECNLVGVQCPDTNFAGAVFSSADLFRSRLAGCRFVGADFKSARLRQADMRGTDLSDAVLVDADLEGTNLCGARLIRTNFVGAHMGGTVLGGVDLGVCTGLQSVHHIRASQVTVQTLQATAQSLEIKNPTQRGYIADFLLGCGIPRASIPWLREEQEGLTLYFNTRLTPFDRFLVDGIIFGVLGRDTDCHVAEFKEQGDSAIVRLVAKDPNDLLVVAEALYQRIWTAQEQAQKQALARLGDVLQLQRMGTALSDHVDHLERMELWLKEHDILDLWAAQGAAHFKERIEKATTPTGVKAAKAGLKLARKWLLKGVEDEFVDGLRDAAKELLSGDS